jgi:hypothetical protein
VAHDYNPGHSGGRNQEDCGLKSILANSSVRPYFKKKKSQQRAGGLAQGIALSSNSLHHQKQRKVYRTNSGL